MEILRQAARLFGHKNRQFETLTELNLEGGKIRIWRTAKTLEAAMSFDHEGFRSQIRAIAEATNAGNWTATLMKLPNVACVAIVDGQGNGVSGYPDWG